MLIEKSPFVLLGLSTMAKGFSEVKIFGNDLGSPEANDLSRTCLGLTAKGHSCFFVAKHQTTVSWLVTIWRKGFAGVTLGKLYNGESDLLSVGICVYSNYDNNIIMS